MIKAFFCNIIFSIGDYFLKKSGNPSQKIVERYKKEKEIIDNLYNQPLYWHGTGRYHYSSSDEVVDVLQKIIEDDGLQPLVKDPWLKVDGVFKNTISLANIRMYASVYAMIHQEEDNDIYLYGSRFLWSMLVGLVNFLQEPRDIIYHALLFTFKDSKGKTLKTFQSKVRKKDKLPDSKPFVMRLMSMPHIRSDISGNYPILFAIKKNAVKEASTDSGFDYFETRTENQICLKDISHIEVPTSKTGETKKFLKSTGIDIKVISFESAELYIKENSSVREQLLPTTSRTF